MHRRSGHRAFLGPRGLTTAQAERSILLARQNFNFQKRQKELAKKKKQEEKKQRKLEKKGQPDSDSSTGEVAPELLDAGQVPGSTDTGEPGKPEEESGPAATP